MHHAYAIEAERERGIEAALGWVERELGMGAKANPDIVILKYGLFTVEDARGVGEIAAVAPVAGDAKVLIIAASRAYREAQNALLKLFEEPPQGTYLFLILPTLGTLLPTLRSRIQILKHQALSTKHQTHASDIAQKFLKASRERRGAMAKRLATGKDEEERREHRDEALAILDGIERAVYAAGVEKHAELLRETSMLRGCLHERSAPVKIVLEHLAIVAPRDVR